jgi:two-component system, chemotaxis family, chemotaxis protein CheY
MISDTQDKFVLVIDDDEDFCASMRELLAGRGYTVRTSPRARDALDILGDATNAPCAIIVDLRMPDVDGYAFLAACQVDVRLREIPIVVVSAYGDPTGIEVDFLSKPVNVSRLLRSLDKITGVARRVAAR